MKLEFGVDLDAAISGLRIRLERDSWILLQALDPQAVPQRIREKNAELGDPETTRLMLACDRAVDWDPRDPRLDRLIDDLDAWEIARARNGGGPGAQPLVTSTIAEASPVWQRIVAALAHRAERRRSAGRAG
ncbi:hypothetical protein [Nocardia sp. IFM 10818]